MPRLAPLCLLFLLALPAQADNPTAAYMQDIGVTVKAGQYSGSGALVQTKDGSVWVWTAGHVVEGCRRTRESNEGAAKKIVEFDDAKVMRFLNDPESGRIVSSYSSDAEVIRYSDAENGHDLALLRLRDKSFKPASSTRFYLDKNLPEVGVELYHIGSLLGPFGSNSLTSGILSRHGRVLNSVVYDQTQVVAFPGSSGGPVCLKADGRYVGMLVRGAGEGFNLIVPVRRMRDWAKECKVDFALDPSLPVPSEEELRKAGVDARCCGGGNGRRIDLKTWLHEEKR